MFWIDLLHALFFALLLSAIFVGLFRTRGPWPRLIFFFLVIFLASWAGGVWLSPFGPTLWGAYWLPFLLAGLFVALLLAAAVPRRAQEESTVELVDAKEERKERIKSLAVLSIFFWVMMAALIVAILGHYF